MISRKRFAALMGVVAVCALIAVGAGAVGAGATATGKGDTGVAYVSIVHQVGKTLYVAGYDFDKLFGQTGVTFVATVGSGKPGTFKVAGRKVTLYTPSGSLVGTGSATEVVTANSVTLTGGKLALTHGTSGQAGHSFTGTFTGTYDSKTLVYTYHVKGTYK